MRAEVTSSSILPVDEPVTDGDCAAIGTFDHEIFAEGAGLQLAPQFLRPPVEVDGAEGIDRLIDTAMVLAIADGIADQAFAIDHHARLDRVFENAGLVGPCRAEFRALPLQTARIFMGNTLFSAIPFPTDME